MIYEYQCINCLAEFEIEHSFKDKKNRKCPICKNKLQKLISAPHFYVHNINTVGQLAEQNNKKFGKDELFERQQKQNEAEKVAKEYARQQLQSKLPRGMTLTKPGNSMLGNLPTDVATAVKTGNKQRIQKYINDGT